MAFRYWVATSGGNWNTTASWSATSGGASGASVPTRDDDVFFDANSITSANRAITVNGLLSCRDLNFTGVLNTPRLVITSGNELLCFGNITIPAGVITTYGGGSGSVAHYAYSGEFFIDCNVVLDFDFYQFVLTGTTGANVYLKSDLVVNHSIQFLISSCDCSFDTKNYNVTAGGAISVGSGNGTLTTGTSTIRLKQSSHATPWNVADTTADVDFSENTINLECSNASAAFVGGDQQYGTVKVTTTGSGSVAISGTNRFTSLTVDTSSAATTTGSQYITTLNMNKSSTLSIGGSDSAIETGNIGDGATLTLATTDIYTKLLNMAKNSNLKLADGTSNWIEAITSTAGSGTEVDISSQTNAATAYINIPNNTIITDFVRIRDITAIGGGSWYAGANSIDTSNNANIFFSALPTYTKDKEVFYRVLSSFGGSLIGELVGVTSQFSFSSEINTGGGAINIEIIEDFDTALDDDKYLINNCVEVWIKDEQAPNGRRIWQGYVADVEFNNSNNKISLSVMSYGNKLDKLVLLSANTTDYTQLVRTFNDYIGTGGASGTAYFSTSFTTGSGVTTLSGIDFLLSSYAGSSNPAFQIKIFNTLADAENITSDTSIATSATIYPTSSAITTHSFTFPTAPTLVASTTYYIRFTVSVDPRYGNNVTIYGDNSAGASTGIRIKDANNATFAYPSDTYYPYIKTYYNSETTSITYTTEDLSDIFKSIIDSYNSQGGELIYTPFSVDITGTTITHTFKTDKIKSAIETCQKAAPKGWYWYVDMSTNIIYFKEERDSSIVDQTFTRSNALQDVKLIKKGEGIFNTIYFSGGETAGVNLFKKYVDTSSYETYGRLATSISDGRVTQSATASAMGDALLDRYKEPFVVITGVIADNNKGTGTGGYDIESIGVGQNISFTGYTKGTLWDIAIFDTDTFDSNINSLSNQVYQVVRIDYSLSKLGFTLNLPLANVYKSLAETHRQVEVLDTANNPSSPT